MGCVCCCGVPIICGVPPKLSAWIYYLGFAVVIAVAWVLRDYGGSALDFGPAEGCNEAGTCGDLAVLRLSFGSMIFFATMALLTLGVTSSENPRFVLHRGFWPFKFLLWGGLIGSTFAMPDRTFELYQYIARVFSAFFILIQLIILLDTLYLVNEYLLEKKNCGFVLILLTVIGIAGSIVGSAFLYKYWAPNASCSLNIFFITWTLVLFLIYGAISVSPLRTESAGLMTSAAVFAYGVFYTWSALQSEPHLNSDGTPRDCVPSGSGGNNTIRIISFVLALLAIGLSTANTGLSSSSFSLVSRKEDSQVEDDALGYRPDFFYLTFMLASSYMGIELENQGEFEMDKGWGSVWAKVIASWVCAALYIWSLVAHRVLKNREF